MNATGCCASVPLTQAVWSIVATAAAMISEEEVENALAQASASRPSKKPNGLTVRAHLDNEQIRLAIVARKLAEEAKVPADLLDLDSQRRRVCAKGLSQSIVESIVDRWKPSFQLGQNEQLRLDGFRIVSELTPD